ncbi:hypothetical protein [Marinisporobacter balticus]|uniref:Uncharacterized protein n=1 Tax=Marinisporobacter balticus TaxID=2018667 RepID=A0A4R2LJ77_9FIRM|nr:hypothetical protein [Marinisporobacter balticus]TCO79415.1 hypothetical protein EV214_102134 [Marinisporobacter balticus]
MFMPLTYNLENGVEVYKKTKVYLKEKNLFDELNELFWVYYSIIDIIPQTNENFSSGHSFPYQDSWDELQISFNLCSLGYYKQAHTSLRSVLELGLLSIYWNINDDGHILIKDWLNSKEDTPRLEQIWKKISKNKNFEAFQKENNIKDRLLKLNDLHNFVHTKGCFYSNRVGFLKSNMNTFEEKAFIKWYKKFKEVVLVVVILHLVKYPLGTIRYDFSEKFGIDVPWFGVLQIFQVDKIEKYIGSEIFNKIHKLSKEDEHVQKIMDIVDKKKNMTEQDIDNQIMESNKREIEHDGFKMWIKNQQWILEKFPKDKKVKNRVEYLENWASENGYIEHKLIRLCKQIKRLKEKGENIEQISNIINESEKIVKTYYDNPDKTINNLNKIHNEVATTKF